MESDREKALRLIDKGAEQFMLECEGSTFITQYAVNHLRYLLHEDHPKPELAIRAGRVLEAIRTGAKKAVA